jgi:hypothetical protein
VSQPSPQVCGIRLCRSDYRGDFIGGFDCSFEFDPIRAFRLRRMREYEVHILTQILTQIVAFRITLKRWVVQIVHVVVWTFGIRLPAPAHRHFLRMHKHAVVVADTATF